MFKYSEYSELLESIKKTRDVIRMCDKRTPGSLIMRHDVDLALEPALRLSQVEQKVGIVSSYFILTTGDTYNVASKYSREILREMVANGFEVGLHFDPLVYAEEASENSLVVAIEKERELLQDVIGCEVKSVSLHNPSISNEFVLFDKWINAYDESIFNPEIYLSDSRMCFHKDPKEFIGSNKAPVLQFLTHPLHYTENGGHYPVPQINFVVDVATKLDDVFRGNSYYNEVMENKTLLNEMFNSYRSSND